VRFAGVVMHMSGCNHAMLPPTVATCGAYPMCCACTTLVRWSKLAEEEADGSCPTVRCGSVRPPPSLTQLR
jgi:hypothetical protein